MWTLNHLGRQPVYKDLIFLKEKGVFRSAKMAAVVRSGAAPQFEQWHRCFDNGKLAALTMLSAE